MLCKLFNLGEVFNCFFKYDISDWSCVGDNWDYIYSRACNNSKDSFGLNDYIKKDEGAEKPLKK